MAPIVCLLRDANILSDLESESQQDPSITTEREPSRGCPSWLQLVTSASHLVVDGIRLLVDRTPESVILLPCGCLTGSSAVTLGRHSSVSNSELWLRAAGLNHPPLLPLSKRIWASGERLPPCHVAADFLLQVSSLTTRDSCRSPFPLKKNLSPSFRPCVALLAHSLIHSFTNMHSVADLKLSTQDTGG